MGILGHAPVADHDICPPVQYRLDQRGDVRAFILSVGVGVHDDVGASGQTGIEPGLKRVGKPAIAAMTHDVMHTPLASQLDRIVVRPIIDDQDLDLVDASNDARQGD